MSQNAWLPVLRTLQTRLWSEGRLQVSRAPSVFTDEGELADAKTDEALRKFLAGFVEFAAARVGAG
ncbi:hypothetical protein [Piscinibacter sp.]|uniref:hypothetical protein n=1 Tax=Piscinibacter sp. TaxID=1903157 RepID=UPI002B901E14|nr:hypothetical protein [Albitalea sp.]HUG21314.1 hypothetical protein [Albitalea sp.]